jgi:hypothetical protein
MIHWFTRRGVICGEFFALTDDDKAVALLTADRAQVTCAGCLAVIPAEDATLSEIRRVMRRVFDEWFRDQPQPRLQFHRRRRIGRSRAHWRRMREARVLRAFGSYTLVVP